MSRETANCGVCGQALGEDGRCPQCDDAGHVWTIRDWRPLLSLSLVIALGLSFTRLVVSEYNDRRQGLATEYYAAGIRALDAQRPGEAVDALESALIYSHDNFQYQLKLTDALLASGATSEAVAQMHAFLDQRPGDAQVNLKLARLEARRHHVDGALRYYLAAIEGDWPEHTDPFPQRVAVRFESAEYLVEQGRKEEAEGALQALAAVLPAAWPEQGKLGDLFLRIGDSGRALNVYQAELDQDRENPDDRDSAEHDAALLGAAQASVAAASYTGARRYLMELEPPTAESRSLLAQLDRMEALDPFARNATGTLRAERTMAVFRIAMERLAGCGAPLVPSQGAVPRPKSELDGTGKNATEREKTLARWNELGRWGQQLAPLMNERKLRGRDDVIESTMRFAFQAETAAENKCGKATLDDEALLLLARERLGAGQ